VTGGRALAGKLVLTHEATWQAELSAHGGRLARDPARHAIVVDEDAVPAVSLEAPAADLEVDELLPVDVRWRAQDDFGITAATLVVVRGGKEERRRLDVPPDVKEHGGAV